jgi:hypothetical protein
VQSNTANHSVGCADTLSTVATVNGVCMIGSHMVCCVVYVIARNVGVTIRSIMSHLQRHIILCTLNMIFITAIWFCYINNCFIFQLSNVCNASLKMVTWVAETCRRLL